MDLATLQRRTLKRVWWAYREAFQGIPRPIWLLAVVLLVNRSGTMVLPFLALYLTQKLGLSLAAAGQILSVYGVGALAGAYLGGWLCDTVGAIRIQFLSLVLSGIGFLALGHLSSVAAIAVVILLTAIVAEAFRPANGAALAALSPPHLRTRAVALNRMALNLGIAIGPAVGGLLAAYDYRWVFLVDGLTCLLAALLLRVLFARIDVTSAAQPDLSKEAEPSRHPLTDRHFLAFMGVTVLFAFCFFQIWGTYAVYLKEVYGLREFQYGALIALNGILILLFEVVLTHRVEVFRPLSVIGAGCFLVGLGMALLPLGRGLTFAVLSVLVWTLGEMLCIPFAGGFVANRAGPLHRGKYMGLYTMAWGVAFILAPATGGWIYEKAGPDTLWYGLGGLGIVIWLACDALRRRVEEETR